VTERSKMSEIKAGANEPAIEIRRRPCGGGYYEIIVDDEVVDTVRGEDASLAWVARRGGGAPWPEIDPCTCR
jgi:hypothetical protein